MEIPEQLRCVFSGQVENQDGSYVIEIPEQELRRGTIQDGQTYRVAVLSSISGSEAAQEEPSQGAKQEEHGVSEPPVTEGETRNVEIEALGEQGDGIARVERGYIVIVPETEPNERVTIEITTVRQTVAFAEVVDRQPHVE